MMGFEGSGQQLPTSELLVPDGELTKASMKIYEEEETHTHAHKYAMSLQFVS